MNRSALSRLETLPRLRLAHLPTPLLEAHALRAHLGPGTPRILIKADDWAGLPVAGNKLRKLEFLLGAMPPETDTLITCGGPQSNHCRVTAAVAARLGLSCDLVVNGPVPDPPTGNALLMQLFGAALHSVPRREDRAPAMERIAEAVREKGYAPLVIPLGASTPLGALGYVEAAQEFSNQWPAPEPGQPVTVWIFLSTSSCGTLAGLALGFALLERSDIRLVGVSADVSAEEIRRQCAALAGGAAELLGLEAPIPEGMIVPEDRFVGEGYGLPTPASREATRIFGRYAGTVLDPTYTAKAGAGLLAWIQSGAVKAEDTVVFWHTGGAPAIFA